MTFNHQHKRAKRTTNDCMIALNFESRQKNHYLSKRQERTENAVVTNNNKKTGKE